MKEDAEARPGIIDSFKRLLGASLAILRNRLELLLVELKEERLKAFEVLMLAGFVLLLALVSLQLVIFTVVILCLRADHRYEILIGLIVLCLAGTGLTFWRLRQRLKNWSPLTATLAELKKDKECLEAKN
jgi:uncharacterized membrane protein YqjE